MSQSKQHDTQAQTEIIETFEMFDDWLEKYQYIIDLGKQLPAMDDAHKTEENLLQGCQSQVWLIHEFQDGKLHFQDNSDAAIVSGLIALVMTIYNDRSPSYITEVEPDFIEKIGLASHLSSTRSNGLNAMIAKIKHTAAAYQ